MAKLTAAKRKKIPAGQFAGPGRSFPINDATHARLAISGATRSANAGNISAGEAKRIKAKARAKLNPKGLLSARMSVGYRGVPTGRVDSQSGVSQLLQTVCNVLNGVLAGKTNNVATVTLTANAASTVVTDSRIGANSAMPLDARTANAAAEIGAGTIWWSSIGKGTATLTHANNAQADRSFTFPIIG